MRPSTAAIAGVWLGRRPVATPGISGLLASARRTNTLPELEPGAVMFNRLWSLAVLAIAAVLPAQAASTSVQVEPERTR